MFDTDLLKEIMQTISMRRRQSLMTAFGVFWGIFMLTMLLGGGMGFDNGIASKVNDLPPNEIMIFTKETSLPYKGFGRDRKWKLNSRDEELIRNHYGQWVLSYSAVAFEGYQNVVRGDQSYQYYVTGVDPQFVNLIPQRITAGRFVNDIDMHEHRKVCVIGERVADLLFSSHKEAIGSTIEVNGMLLTVVGVTHCTNRHMDIGIDLSENILLPLPTEQAAYGRGDDIDMCSVIMDDAFSVDEKRGLIEDIVKKNHYIHPDDQLAMMTLTMQGETRMFRNLLVGSNILIWIVGLGTLIAGLIGITNIMLVSVRERTQEIGIRRSIGAKPHIIFKQIMLESLFLTLSSGLLGLCVAAWLLHFLGAMIPKGDEVIIARPSVPFWTAIAALLILVAGGLVAGWMPARRALAIKPIEALKEE